MKKILFYLIAVLFFTSCKTQNISGVSDNNQQNTSSDFTQKHDYYQPNRLKYIDENYLPQIGYSQLSASSWVFAPPIIYLDQNNTLTLTFDEISDNKKDYYYSFILCDAMWQPCDLLQSEYIQVFFEDQITSFQFSRNTLVNYVHYTLTFPNENMQPTKSGNYLLHVWYYNGNEKVTALTKRFYISENKINIQANIRNATAIEYRNYQHEIDFSIFKNNVEIIDPYKNLTVVLQQNGRYDNCIKNLKPSLIRGDELIYDFENENIFDANNEFRRFDIQSLNYYTDKISKIERRDQMIHVYLKTDFRRPYQQYISTDDINGRFLIKNEDGKDIDTESEYVWVHFLLSYDYPLNEGSIFLQGAFTNWGFNEKYKLNYDYKLKGYSDSLLLKQGYYNYQYVYLKDTEASADAAFIEGRHAEADNDYTIYVYYREPGEYYDRLIGVRSYNSKNKK